MSECMQFPDTWEDFEQAYSFEDKKEIYTNGSRLIQSFRVKQWLDHIAEPKQKWTLVSEALPWNDTEVLVTVLDDSGDTPWSYTSVGWCTPDRQYWVVDNEICYGVVAWMPLPEPWRGDR